MWKKKKKQQKEDDGELQLWQTATAPEFKPKAAESQAAQAMLISARQNPGFPVIGGQIGHALQNRATDILLDYSQNAVGIRYQVDGMWEQLPPMDRQTGDAMLHALKVLCGLNPADRRNTQSGKVGLKLGKMKLDCVVRTQGVQTGERVLIHFDNDDIPFSSLAELGIREGLVKQLREALNDSGGIVVLSAPKGQGLTTTWNVALEAADRFMRDFQSVEPHDAPEREVININQNLYGGEHKPAAEVVRTMMLKEPDVYVMPSLIDDDLTLRLIEQIDQLDKHVITRTVGNDAVEALVQLLAQHRKIAPKLIEKIRCVTGQRLVRRLCDDCKQGFQPQPQLLQKLGIPEGRVGVLYRQFVPPPIEQQVDEKGRPAPIPPCPTCGGRGFLGRAAIFEILTLNDQLKDAFKKTNDVAKLRKYAEQLGHKTLQQEAILTVARGLTSLEEIRRVFSSK